VHTHACPDTLIERSRFPCVHPYTSKRRQKRDCTRPKRGGKARRRRLVVVRVSSRSSRSLSHPRFFGLATHERERERGRRRRRFPAFFTSRIVCKSRVLLCDRSNDARRRSHLDKRRVFFLLRETTKGPRKTRSAVDARASARAQTSDDGGRNV